MSKLEDKVRRILNTSNLLYKTEFNLTDRLARHRFDFYIPSLKVAIEVQGEQHYQFIKKFYKTRSDFKMAQERDRRKISYCLANNIKLYCIPYWEINSLESIDDIIQDKFLAKNKFHNDEAYFKKNNL